eukprot:TRINITY_DN1223_c0_g1_i8.p1 TRINITY_DN1223_c0_g1~~TRINITY_DN1223_c0_g1_i8.p1  ORF type:complete len:792 (-),score=116.99 TRINITY_DN1223_c0_g1_i8:107-2482(-)
MPIPGPIAQVQPLQATQPTNAMTPGWPGAPNIQQGGPIGQAMPIPGPIAQVQPLQATQPTTSMTPGLPGAPKIQEGGPIGQAMPIPDPVAQVQPLQATPVPARVTHGEQGLAVPKVPHVVVPKPKAVIVPAAPMSKAQAPAPPEMLEQNASPADGPKQQDEKDKDRTRLDDRRHSRTPSRSRQVQRLHGRSRSRSRRSRSGSRRRRSSSGFDSKQQEDQTPGAGSAPPGTDITQYSNGEDVDVRYNQSWYAGKVMRMGMNGCVLVVVDGTEYSIDAKDLRRKALGQTLPHPKPRQDLTGPGQRQDEARKGKGKEDASKGKSKGKGKTKKGLGKSCSTDNASSFCVGALVEARYRGNWFEGKIVKLISQDKASVQVDGTDYEMDIAEVRHVTRGLRGSPGVGLCVGKDVEANYRGKWFDSQISAFMDGGKVRVRYEGRDYVMSFDDIRERTAVRESEDVKMSPPQKLQRTSKWSDSPLQSPEDLHTDLKSSNMGAHATDGESTPVDTYMELSAKASPPMQKHIHSDESINNEGTGDIKDTTLNGGAVPQIARSKAPPARTMPSAPMPRPVLPPPLPRPPAPAVNNHSADDTILQTESARQVRAPLELPTPKPMQQSTLPPPRPRPPAPAVDNDSADDIEMQTESAGQDRATLQLPTPKPMQQSTLPATRGKSGWMPRPKQAPQPSQFQEELTDEQEPSPQPDNQAPLPQTHPSPQPSQQSELPSQVARSMPGVRPKFGGSINGELGNNAPNWMPKAKSSAPLPRPSSVAGGDYARLSTPSLPQPKPGPRAAA